MMGQHPDPILDSLPQAIFFLDQHHAVSYANPACLEHLGLERESFCGRPLSGLFPNEKESVTEALKGLAEGRSAEAVFETSPGEAGQKYVRLTVRLFPSMEADSTKAFVGGVEDLSKWREMEERQAALLKVAETAGQELKEFLSIVSHDLKAPLRGISSLAGWIRDDFTDRLGEEGRENLELLIRRVQRMYAMIEGLLRFSRIANSTEARGPVDLEALLAETLRILSPKEGIRVLQETPLPVVEGQRGVLRELFQCLLDNAQKAFDGGEGEIRLGASREASRWKIWIQDNGRGIPSEHQERIFKLFQKVSPEEEGIGVGLTLARKIVRMEGGELSLQSKPGEGTVLSFSLPMAERLPIQA
jgi:two-component system sensor kinase FixL